MRDIFVTLIVFGFLPRVLREPYVGILLWSWIGYMNPHRLAWGFAQTFPFAYIIGVTTLVALAFSSERKQIPLTSITCLLIVFNIWMLLTTAFSIFPEFAWPHYLKVFKIQLMTFATLMLMGSRDRINALIWVIVASIGFYGVKGGIYTILSGGGGIVWGPPGGYIEGNNELGLALLMVLPLAYYLRTISDNKWVRFGLLSSMGLIIISAIGTQSRGALLAAAAVLIAFWAKSDRKLVSAIVVIIIAFFIFSFMPETWHERMQTIGTYEQDSSAMRRINSWWTAFNLAKDRLSGGGFEFWSKSIFARYAPVPEQVQDAHSIYFEVLGEHGFIGLSMFLVLGFLAFRNGRWIIKHSHNEELIWLNTLARMIQTSLIAYAVGGAFLGLAYFDLYYHLLVILVLARKILEGKMEGIEALAPSTSADRVKFVQMKKS